MAFDNSKLATVQEAQAMLKYAVNAITKIGMKEVYTVIISVALTGVKFNQYFIKFANTL